LDIIDFGRLPTILQTAARKLARQGQNARENLDGFSSSASCRLFRKWSNVFCSSKKHCTLFHIKYTSTRTRDYEANITVFNQLYVFNILYYDSVSLETGYWGDGRTIYYHIFRTYTYS